jgi:hypothetical protein
MLNDIRGDVDDAVIALAAACRRLGMETKIVLVPTPNGDWTVHLHVRDDSGTWVAHDPLSPSTIRSRGH